MCLQALLEANLAISPSLPPSTTAAGAPTSQDESKARVLRECEAFWESEFPRLGECTRTTSRVGYGSWCHLGRPEDGWVAGGGITGHAGTDLLSGTVDISVAADEPTVEEYLMRAQRCADVLHRRVRSLTDDVDVDNLPPLSVDVGEHINPTSSLPQAWEDGTMRVAENISKAIYSDRADPTGIDNSKNTHDSLDRTTGGSEHRTPAAAFFGQYGDGDDEQEVEDPMSTAHVASASIKGPASVPLVGVDDGMVYSRVHGYRIKIDSAEDTSLAYKKVLGDINVSQESYQQTGF